nr:MAG TPA: MqsA [Caudoviricetes sp.]
MTTLYCPTYFCNFCEQEFEVGERYRSGAEAFDKAKKELLYNKAVHICNNGNIGVGTFIGFERVEIGD